ncbi:CocE/NonD family hydrolase [Luteimonas sp. TWI1437]|uniref:CocE/NonD family hydrolase n=1 Tax=unclassified Luteimonas TaxID=2629088 RepID=UPI00320B7A40
MSRSLIRWLALCVLLAVCTAASAAGFNKTYERIPSWDGTQLGALVLVPRGHGPGPFPLIVMPASWSLPNLEYVGRAAQLANDGYVVVSYTSRGFWDSAGRIDIAGPPTVEDVSAVIDWALTHTPANPDAIGASGISYGAGVSLLAAARDPRIRAVAALSGWADLEASLYANRTVSRQGVALLVGAGALTGRPGQELAAITARVALGDYDGAVEGFLPQAASRGAVHEVDEINRNGTAVLIANAFNDSLFPPNQSVDFYQRLRGPRQLLLSQGDHATAELPGALGLPNTVYEATTRWFDRHLKGRDPDASEPAVRLATLDGQWLAYADWDAVQADQVTYGLTRPSGLVQATGTLAARDATGWNHRIATGVPTVAEAGPVLIGGLLQGFGVPVVTSMPLVSRLGAAVWAGPVYPNGRILAGAPTLRITVVPDRREVSLFAYLYSVDALGMGQLLTHKPYSLRDAVPGQPRTLDIALEATAAKIPAGRRLVLVVDTLDLRYADATAPGRALTFASPREAPSQLRVPLH